MKNWLKIIKGEAEESSKKISLEIEGIEKQIQEAQTKADTLRDEFKQAGIECLGCGGSEKAIVKIESDVKSIERDIELFEEVKKALCEKQGAAIEKEKAARVDEIDVELEKIRAKNLEMRKKAREMGAELAALFWLCYGENQRAISSLMILDHDEGIRFRAAFEKFVEGQPPFRIQEQELMNERKKLKG